MLTAYCRGIFKTMYLAPLNRGAFFFDTFFYLFKNFFIFLQRLLIMRDSPKDIEIKMSTDYTDFFVFFIICVTLYNPWNYFRGGNSSWGRWGIVKPCEEPSGIVHNMRIDTDIFVLDATYLQSR